MEQTASQAFYMTVGQCSWLVSQRICIHFRGSEIETPQIAAL
jgi:hypothetical protein